MRKILLLFFIGFLSLQLQAQSSETKAVSNAATIKVYPNPTTNYIAITDKNEVVKEMYVYNLIGRKLKTHYVQSDKKYDLSDLPKGLYLVQLVGHDKKVITTKRISKR